MALIQAYEERELFDQVVEYYHSLHEDIRFSKIEAVIPPSKIAEMYYTNPGIENNATFTEKVHEIKKAINHGYDTPVIILKKGEKDILIDGHRRLRAAWELGVGWSALVMIPNKDKEFGVEKLIQGQIKDIWK